MLFDKDATFYAEQVKNKEVTVTQLIEHALGNIKSINPKLNAITHVQANEALDQAQEYDEHLEFLSKDEIQQLPPFYGVPILLKDLGQTEAGQPDTSGAKLLKDYVSPETNNFVQQVLDGGFIVIGRTNVPEFGFKNTSDSDVLGVVNSPFDTHLNPGGSSGGAAAALKTGIVPIVTASDGGGSIRIPASFTGLIGLKTSRGRTPVGPGSFRGWQGATVNFALTKSIRDTWAMLKVMQVEQYDAPFILPLISENELVPLDKRLKFAYCLEHPINKEVTEDAKNTVRTAVNFLTEAGHQVKEMTPDTDGVKAMQTYYIVNGVETATMIEGIETGMDRPVQLDDMEVMSWALYRAGYKITGIEYSKVLAFWDQLTAQMEAFFEEYDALILPTTNGPAFPQNHFELPPELVKKLENIDNYKQEKQQDLIWEMFDKSLAYTPFTQQQNLTGQPAISLPLYETATGLPVGTQIWTKKGAEYLLLQIAKEFEDAGLIHTDILELDS